MPLLQTWKSAKKTFETETSKKKPSAGFRKWYQKGVGIESALKSVDSAKTPKDLTKAVQKLETEGLQYCKQLKDIVGDEPKENRSTYQQSVNKLEKALRSLVVQAEAKNLIVVDKKLLEAADEHLALRMNMVPLVKGRLKDTLKTQQSLGRIVTLAKKQWEQAKQEAKANNKMGVMMTVDLINRYLEEMNNHLSKARAEVADQGKSGGDLMRSRTDFGDVDKLPEAYQAKYKKDSGKPFREVTNMMRLQNKALDEMQGQVDTVETWLAEAEKLSGQAKDPKVYLKQLTEIHKALESAQKTLSRRIEQVDGGVDSIKKTPTVQQMDRKAKLKAINTRDDFKKGYDDWVELFKKSVENSEKRVNALPRGAREDSSVDRMAREIEKLAKAAKADFPKYEAARKKHEKAMQEALAQIG